MREWFNWVKTREASTSEISILAIDLAKNSFQVCGVRADGVVVFNRSVSRPRLLQLLSAQESCIVAMASVRHVPHLQVSPGLAERGLCHQGRGAGLGEIFHQLVQQRAPPQRDPLRHAKHAPRCTRPRYPRKPRHSLCKCTGAKTRTMVRKDAQLAARRTRLAEPGTRNRRA